MAISLVGLPFPVCAAGSGLNLVLVVNQNSSESVELGNYYAERRQLPPQNILRIQWPGGNVQWTQSEYESVLLSPLLAMLASRQLTNQIDYVLLSMDIPYRVTTTTNGDNSTTSTLFYGFKPDSLPLSTCPMAPSSTSLYAGSEGIFRSTPPINADSNSFLATMITSSNLMQAKIIVDRGAASDSTFPAQKVYLGKSTDTERNIRYQLFDNAIFNTRLRGNYSMQRTNIYGIGGLGDTFGAETGGYSYGVDDVTFAPGAMADNLTSFGGLLFEPNAGELNILSLLAGGATGSYGTIVEPCAYLEKFPNPLNYFYQARGFTLAECYYQSVANPYQGIIVGEPLAAPFARPAAGAWNNLSTNALLSGTTNLSLQFAASDVQHPLQQVDLFLDGTWLQTLTNIPPRKNNRLYITVNGFTTNSVVPAGATIQMVASNLTVALNGLTNASKVLASAHGDRIELQSFDPSKTGGQIPISVSNSVGGASILTTFLTTSRSNFLDSIVWGVRKFIVSKAPLPGDFLQLTVTKTNGAQVTVAVTNTPTTNTSGLTQRLFDAINTNPDLQMADGLVAQDFVGYDPSGYALANFNLLSRTPGLNAAQIQAGLSGSAAFVINPTGINKLDGNLSVSDLQPRNHLYVTAGTTNLSFNFPLNTASIADGYHELTAVVYEGSHVRTQKGLAQSVRIQNTPLAATFNCLVGGSNTAVEATLQFAVTANTNNIAKIELFSTGGLLATVANQSTAGFSIAGTNLDLGLHPFYAVVTAINGKQYRTETKFIRFVGTESVSVNSATFCAGDSATLTATNNASNPSYLWSNGETNASITVSPDSTTNYTVTVTDGTTFNVNWGSSTVTVIPLPGLTLTETDATTRRGSDGTVTVTVSDGTPPYLVTLDTTTRTISTSGGVTTFTGLSAGSRSVSVTDKNGTGCTTFGYITVGEPGYIMNIVSAGGGDPSTNTITYSSIAGQMYYLQYTGVLQYPNSWLTFPDSTNTDNTLLRVYVDTNAFSPRFYRTVTTNAP